MYRMTQKTGNLKCVVAAMCSWQHCGTGTLSYRQPRHSVIMDQWNGQQRAFAIKMFYKNNESLEGAQKEFWRFFNLGHHGRVPSKHVIKTWIKNFEEIGLALKKKPTGRPRSAHTPQNIEAVRVSVLWSPWRSVRKLAAAVRLSRECVCRILHVDLKFHPYKLQIVQKLKENDHQLRLEFCQQITTNINKDNEFLDKAVDVRWGPFSSHMLREQAELSLLGRQQP